MPQAIGAQFAMPDRQVISMSGDGGFLPTGTRLDNPNFADMAESMGIYGARVEDPAQLKPAISAAFAHDGPAVIDVVTDRHELVMPPEIKLEQAKGFSLWMLKAVLNGQANEIVDVGKTALLH